MRPYLITSIDAKCLLDNPISMYSFTIALFVYDWLLEIIMNIIKKDQMGIEPMTY